ncbi:GNAT family N-acetyltransferase [Luteimicrobium sp. DT211]|uniref:GNAT family N-acetyltransferase n=1 Tax=Luteimicrobium sp. DT211 TaxID=3393412 RepID=UPI003CE77BED
MLSPAYPVRTPRLVLRPLTVDDAPALAAYQSRPDVCRFLLYEPRDERQIAALLLDPTRNRSELTGPGQSLWLALCRADDGTLVGDVVLMWQDAEQGAGEVGYVLDPRHHGHGYATEAVEALLGLAFDGLGLHRVVGRLDARNAASAGVLRGAGMRREAHLASNETVKGEWTDEVVYAVLGEEWRGPRAAGRPPVREHAVLPVRPGSEAAFEAAFREARPLIEATPGFRGLTLSRSLESPSTYLLLVDWSDVAAHEEGFRGSERYARWRALLHPFYDPFPVVEHFVAVS